MTSRPAAMPSSGSRRLAFITDVTSVAARAVCCPLLSSSPWSDTQPDGDGRLPRGDVNGQPTARSDCVAHGLRSVAGHRARATQPDAIVLGMMMSNPDPDADAS